MCADNQIDALCVEVTLDMFNDLVPVFCEPTIDDNNRLFVSRSVQVTETNGDGIAAFGLGIGAEEINFITHCYAPSVITQSGINIKGQQTCQLGKWFLYVCFNGILLRFSCISGYIEA